MYKEDVAHVYLYNGMLLSHNKGTGFVEIWMDLETII